MASTFTLLFLFMIISPTTFAQEPLRSPTRRLVLNDPVPRGASNGLIHTPQLQVTVHTGHGTSTTGTRVQAPVQLITQDDDAPHDHQNLRTSSYNILSTVLLIILILSAILRLIYLFHNRPVDVAVAGTGAPPAATSSLFQLQQAPIILLQPAPNFVMQQAPVAPAHGFGAGNALFNLSFREQVIMDVDDDA